VIRNSIEASKALVSRAAMIILKFINNSSRENKGNHSLEGGLDM